MEDTLKSHYETLTEERYIEVSNEINEYVDNHLKKL